jgi:hypothetical protein
MRFSSLDFLNSSEAAILASVAHHSTTEDTEKNRQSSVPRISIGSFLPTIVSDRNSTRDPLIESLRVYTGRCERKNEKATRQLGSLFFKGE